MADTADTPGLSDTTSDYGDFGSDAEEVEILDQLVAELEKTPLLVTDIEDYEPPTGVLRPRTIAVETRSSITQPQVQVDSQVLREYIDTQREEARHKQVEQTPVPEPEDTSNRSPLERFRKPPKKALSVTDLVSPAWCELQYFYTLSKHGRKRRTPAMKQGSAVHKALEEEIHTVVPIDITKPVDSWGLRFWNVCQGLKTLRESGRTRELEVWGSIGGEIVNGVIDELSYECPDPSYHEPLRSKATPLSQLPEYQTSITEFLLAKPKAVEDGEGAKQEQEQEQGKSSIYITDVKTRSSPTLPAGASLKPTVLQLHLYHHMLENLAQSNVSLQILSDRYGFDVDEPFSDGFLAQLGSLNQEPAPSQASESQGRPPSTQDSMDILLQNNNLRSLWAYMIAQFKETFLLTEEHTQLEESISSDVPASQQSVSKIIPSPSQPTRLSPLLTAEYLASNYQHLAGTKKRSLGRKSFQFNAAYLKSYLEDNLQWWHGERAARGVELQEAWKCRHCDFRDDCEWIHERNDAAFNEAMERKRMRELAGVEGKSPSRSKV